MVASADGPAIAIRAELDALPVAEATGVPWSATGTRMHACGHDVHLAALTALCTAARQTRTPPPAAILAVFQPREESIPSGALDVAASPVLRVADTLIAGFAAACELLDQ